MSFSGDMERAAKRILEAQDKIARAATLDFFGGTIRDTPVDTGRARGSWTTGVGAEPATSPDRDDPSGSAAMAEVEAKTPQGAGQEVFMISNLPYIDRLEHGHSKQAPAGMVRRNLARVQRIVDAAVAKFRV